MHIEPGLAIYIVHEQTLTRADLLEASIYDVKGNRIVLSQTLPPLPESLINKSVVISFISKKGPNPKRMGFLGVISKIIDNFELSSHTLVPAIILVKKKDLAPMTLRRSTRIRPPEDGSLCLLIQRKNYRIFDISLHGINFIQSKVEEAFDSDQVFELILGIDEEVYSLNGKVIRISDKGDARHTAVDFIDLDKEIENILGIKLFATEMQNMFHGM